MKTRQILFAVLLLAATTVSAQEILKGDMNNDKEVTIADVTSLVNVVLGKAPQEIISPGCSCEPYKVDNSSVVGIWYAPNGTSFEFREDGTTTFPEAATYKFRPVQGVLTVYDSEGTPLKAIVINEVTAEYLLAVDYATNTFIKYTKQIGQPEIPDTHEYVDLGLPSGTLWATCNIGADNPEDYGDYFAWGETEGYNGGKITFNWTTYKWCKGSENTMTKYCNNSSYGYEGFTDELTELELEDDAAYVNWGAAWRMPSIEQFQELIDNNYTTTEWTTQNGVNGYLITSKINDNSIFLPAAGYCYNSPLNYAGSFGYYWSCTLDTSIYSSRCARDLLLHSSYITTLASSRYYGRSVRPVRATE